MPVAKTANNAKGHCCADSGQASIRAGTFTTIKFGTMNGNAIRSGVPSYPW